MRFKETLAGILFCAAILYFGACSGDTANSTSHAEGQAVFTKYCALCHGEDGKRQLNGAKDITISQMPLTDRITLIKTGKNLMAPYGSILSPKEIEAVAKYSMALK